MYINVTLFGGVIEPLTYRIPEGLPDQIKVGSLVRVPVRTSTRVALVIARVNKPQTAYEIKDIIGLEPFPHDDHFQPYIKKLADYYRIDPLRFIWRMKQFIGSPVTAQEPSSPPDQTQAREAQLTAEQQTAVDAILPSLDTNEFSPHVIHGVTGSGKTMVYRFLIQQALGQGKSVILLLPEVMMAVAFEHTFKQWFSADQVVGFHSASSVKEKKRLWQSLLYGKPQLIIGVHLPMLLPIPHLGLIVVDEEHETGFQEKRYPKINAKEAALLRAQQQKIPIVLGSATPSLQTLHQVKTKGWPLHKLEQRYAGAFPSITVVPLRDQKQRKNFWITPELERAIADRLEKGEQTIIFMNRRGFCFFVQCKECSFIFSCPNCSVSLTLHVSETNNSLRCHYCEYAQQAPTACSSCKSSNLLNKGIGTQQVVTTLQKLFPHARIGRADLDSTAERKKWQQTIDAMTQYQLDILVGTQMVTKGYHFPKVTLVGVLWADVNLSMPIFNAAETCLQQLIQVAGRAGRASKGSQVIIQSMIDHPIFNYLEETKYPEFYTTEIAHREILGYPPCKRLAELEMRGTDEAQLEKEAQAIAEQLYTANKHNIQILGPALPPVHKMNNWFVRKIYLKAPTINHIASLLATIDARNIRSRIFYTPNPLGL